MLNFCDFIQDYVFSTNHHLNTKVHNSVKNTCGVTVIFLCGLLNHDLYLYQVS